MPTDIDRHGDLTAALGLLSMIIGLLHKAFKIHELVLDTAKELRLNHGSSLRDQVDATRQSGRAGGSGVVIIRYLVTA